MDIARVRITDFIATHSQLKTFLTSLVMLTVSVNRWYAMDRNGSTGGSDLSFTSEAPNEVEKAYDLLACRASILSRMFDGAHRGEFNERS